MIVNIHAAKTQLSRLVEAAEGGQEIIIARAGKPVARLCPIESSETNGVTFGMLAGKFRIPDDFDAPLPDHALDLFEKG